jgi:uncharacterized protein (DUF2141 family)
MNRDRRYPSLAIIALGSLLGSAAMPQEEFVFKQLMQCAIDIPVHCDPTQFGGGRVVRCLQAKRADITPECRAAVTPTDFPDSTEGLRVGVTIDKLKSRQGTVIILLNEDPATFPKTAKRTVVMPIDSETLASAFRHLKPGIYAVTAMHDLDNNGKFDAGEGFAASNSVVSPPSFAASAMKIDKNTTVTLSMRYP